MYMRRYIVDKKVNIFSRYLYLLLTMMITVMLTGCGDRGGSAVPGMSASLEAGTAPELETDAVEDSDAGTLHGLEAGVSSDKEAIAAQSPGAAGNSGADAAQDPEAASPQFAETGAAQDRDMSDPQVPDQYAYDFILSFAGDINFDENWDNMMYLETTENGIHDCISPELIQAMRDADIMCINNEFTFSTRGAPLKNKVYTFKAHPSKAGILKDIGVDIVSLANNHVYDYGEESLVDTMATLKEAGIKYVGAGHNLAEAMEPVYFEIQGKTVAYVAASRAEKYRMTPQATEDRPGILRCYDTELFVQTIKKARENADFVIAYVHWGTEFTHKLDEVQLETGKLYLDSGADAVIGAHPHRLQGIEFYKGKPIIYSLGNFWFNDETVDTMLLNIRFYGDEKEGSMEIGIVPAIQADLRTTIVTDQSEKERIFSFLEDISVNAEISETGIVTERSFE